MQCLAKSKRSGEQCRRQATPGRKVCHIHGGKSLAGPASGTYKTGRYSKLLPARMAATYLEAAGDPDLLVLREEIALVYARLSDLLGRVDSGESGAAWRRAQTAFKALTEGLDQQDTAAAKAALRDLDVVIRQGLGDHAAWDEIGDLLDRRERLVRSERRRMVEMQQTMTIEQAMVFTGAVIALVDQYVTDQHARAAISNGIRRLVSAGSRDADFDE